MALKIIICLIPALIVFFFVMSEIVIVWYEERRAKKKTKIKKIGDFTIKEYALLCKKHLKNGCKDCPFLILNHCISTYMYPAGIPFNNAIERKEK